MTMRKTVLATLTSTILLSGDYPLSKLKSPLNSSLNVGLISDIKGFTLSLILNLNFLVKFYLSKALNLKFQKYASC